ncbi:uncharacterized protein LOC132558705 [Ylistrum balloti]|uniref:uncharacterized protein LOC132558705 n=1 Tax=Ylistrum balloti TaxID=509963 RepID=UPI002905D5E5|nr:uncharacterized protein LOC132558705 [Ylistrum balloti]
MLIYSQDEKVRQANVHIKLGSKWSASLAVEDAETRVRHKEGSASVLLFEPSFVSDWTTIETQASTEVKFTHDFGELPVKVVAELKLNINGEDLIFNALGSAQIDDDSYQGTLYGGIICLYNEDLIHVFAPKSASNPIGRLAYVGETGWKGPLSLNPNDTRSGHVRVKAWKAWDFPRPDFYHPWTELDVLNHNLSFHEIPHNLGRYPDYVIVQINGTRSGMTAEAIGSISVLKQYHGYMVLGGVMFGYSDTAIRVWAPVYLPISTSHTVNLISTSDGWAVSTADWIYDGQGQMRIFAWVFDESPLYATSFSAQHFDFNQSIYIGDVLDIDTTLDQVEAQVLEGPNIGYRFPAVGSVSNDGFFGPYGGLIYAKSSTNVSLWAPVVGTEGYIFHLSELGHWGSTETYQTTNNVDIRIIIWQEYLIENVTCPIDRLSDFEAASNTDVVVHDVVYNANITFGCQYGYMYDGGNTSATCDRYGDWNSLNNATISCKLILCDANNLSSPNAQVHLPVVSHLDDVVTYGCDPGYELIGGNLSRVCLSDGTWSGSAPLCQFVTTTTIAETTTPVLETTTTTACTRNGLEVPFAEMTISDTGDTVTYTCLPYYPHIDGNLTRTCKSDGTWSGMAPVCEYCLCPCSDNSTVPEATLTQLLQELKDALTVEPSKTSLAIRKKISVYEDRASAKGLGALGVAVLVCVILLIIVPDIPRIASDIRH